MSSISSVDGSAGGARATEDDLLDAWTKFGFHTEDANGHVGASITQLRLLCEIEDVTLRDFQESPNFVETTAVDIHGEEFLTGYELVDGVSG